MSRGFRTAPAVVLAALFLAACRPGGGGFLEISLADPSALRAVELAPGERLQVVASTSIVAEVAAFVGGEHVDVSALIPPGIDPHAFEPTPQDLVRVAEAHVILINGFGLEASLEQVLSSAGEGVPVVSLSEGIPPRTREGEAYDLSHAAVDPHTWLDPNNLRVWVGNTLTALLALDPGHAEAYRHAAETYAAELIQLDVDIRSAVEAIPAEQRLLVTDHEELGYFADRYGFRLVGALIPSTSSAAESSAQALAELEETIRRLGVRAVFVSAAASPDLARRLAQDTGVELVSLYLHSLSGPEGPAPDYTTLMRYNVEQIVDALAP